VEAFGPTTTELIVANNTLTTFANCLRTEQFRGIVALLLADRGSLPQHPALIEQPGLESGGSVSLKVSAAGLLGYDALAAKAETDQVTSTTLSDATASLSIARKAKRYDVAGLTRLVDSTGTWNTTTMAADAVASAFAFLLSQIAALMDNFATVKGSTGTDLTIENFLDAITALEIAKVAGPYLSIMHPRAWGDVRSDVALTSGGAIQWSTDAEVALTIRSGLGYQGRVLGVDVITSTYCLDDATDVWGGVFGRGALVYGWANPSKLVDSDDQVCLADKILFERVRTADYDLSAWQSAIYTGAVELLDACGVSLRCGRT
jgi:hypothetical protein